MRNFVLILVSVLHFSLSTNAQDDATKSPRFVVNLLDYIAADYGGAVADGKVVSEAEYAEQIEFLDAALQALDSIPATKSDAKLVAEVQAIKVRVLAKAPSEEIASRSQAAKLDVIERTGIAMAPTTWPDLKNGAKLYAQNCTSCHGDKGFGDGVAGKGLEPAPADFHGEGMANSAPAKSFNVIRVGVPGTGMVAYNALSDKEVWDLAFYVNSLRFEGKAAKTQDIAALANAKLEDVAVKTDSQLIKSLTGTDDDKTQLVLALRTHSGSGPGGNSLQLAEIELRNAFEEYKKGQFDSAKTHSLKAYLEGIEPVEPTLKAKDSAFVAELEKKMAAVRSSIESRLPEAEVRTAIENATLAVGEAKAILGRDQGSSPLLTFTLAAGILLREGFEAILVLIALLAVIKATGDKRAARWVHGGWVAAVGLGVIAWFFSGWLMNMSGIGRESMEGAISLIAVVVLLSVGGWLHRRTEIQRWKEFIEGHVKRLIEGNNVIGIALLSFMAVFREAFETVLFLRAIWLDAGTTGRPAMWLGVVVAFALVVALAWALLKWSTKLPLRKVFTFSSLLIIALAVILAGKGVHAFQETGLISFSDFGWNLQSDLFGFYSTRETVLAQLAALIAGVAIWIYGQRPSGKTVPAATHAA